MPDTSTGREGCRLCANGREHAHYPEHVDRRWYRPEKRGRCWWYLDMAYGSRVIRTVAVLAASEDEARDKARRYVAANIYPRAVTKGEPYAR